MPEADSTDRGDRKRFHVDMTRTLANEAVTAPEREPVGAA